MSPDGLIRTTRPLWENVKGCGLAPHCCTAERQLHFAEIDEHARCVRGSLQRRHGAAGCKGRGADSRVTWRACGCLNTWLVCVRSKRNYVWSAYHLPSRKGGRVVRKNVPVNLSTCFSGSIFILYKYFPRPGKRGIPHNVYKMPAICHGDVARRSGTVLVRGSKSLTTLHSILPAHHVGIKHRRRRHKRSP